MKPHGIARYRHERRGEKHNQWKHRSERRKGRLEAMKKRFGEFCDYIEERECEMTEGLVRLCEKSRVTETTDQAEEESRKEGDEGTEHNDLTENGNESPYFE